MSAPKDIVETGAGKAKGKKMDAYELSEAVDIFKKYNEKMVLVSAEGLKMELKNKNDGRICQSCLRP